MGESERGSVGVMGGLCVGRRETNENTGKWEQSRTGQPIGDELLVFVGVES